MVLAQLIKSFSLIADAEYPGHSWPETEEEAIDRWGDAMKEYYGSMATPVPGGGTLLTVAIEAFKAELAAGIKSQVLKLDPIFNNLHKAIGVSVDTAGWKTTIPYQLGIEDCLLKPDDYLGTSAEVISKVAAVIDARTRLTFSQLLVPPYTIMFWT